MCVYSNSSKGENNLGRIILENQSVFWWTGNKEEGLIGVYSLHLYTYVCGCIIIEVQIIVFF